ncbi:MAG: hypothetical protein IPK82_40870 [Polyangiaceae bacterium]|nr:hypothetical protein [Polyangiaceae bacterium]
MQRRARAKWIGALALGVALAAAFVVVKGLVYTQAAESPVQGAPATATSGTNESAASDSSAGNETATDSPSAEPGGDPSSQGSARDAAGATAGGDPALGHAPKVLATEPSGVHIPLDAQVVVHFDRDVKPGEVSLLIDPVIEGKTRWLSPQTLVFAPVRWSDGKKHHVRVLGVDPPTFEFEFSTMSPPPERIEPGRGERILFTFDDGSRDSAPVIEI